MKKLTLQKLKNLLNKKKMIKFFLNIINLPMRKFIYYVIHPIRKVADILINNEFKRFTENPKNPLNKYGKRVFFNAMKME